MNSLNSDNSNDEASVLQSFSHDLESLVHKTVNNKVGELDKRESILVKREKSVAHVFECLGNNSSERITVVVGNREFNTTRKTLLSHGASFFHALLDPRNFEKRALKAGVVSESIANDWCSDLIGSDDTESPVSKDDNDDGVVRQFFIARDPDIFQYVLEYLTYGDVLRAVPDEGSMRMLKMDAEYYNLTGLLHLLQTKRHAEEMKLASIEDAISKVELATTHALDAAADCRRSNDKAFKLHFSATVKLTNGNKKWDKKLLCDDDEFNCSPNNTTFTSLLGGVYRITVKVNGQTSGANSDHIAIHLDGSPVRKAYVGSDTGYMNSFHLNELITLKKNGKFSIHQQINSYNLITEADNTLMVELVHRSDTV